ncbi:MAG: hypothetical protein HXS54_17355, partial [Theionarchaea archaeon]|nr:hypothetical protein [Theionarchaea archaeon]
HTYSYDEVGNRTAKDGVSYTINSVNEITSLSDGTTFTHDDNGNRTQKTKGTDTWDYTYDYANRLTKIEENSAATGEYVYDGDGRRIQVIESNVTTCIYSGLNILYEENSTGTAAYIYGLTGILAKRTTINSESTTYYFHTDHLGSTRLVTNDSRNIVSAATYHPFGEPHTEEGSEDYLFAGKKKDDTGLYYFGARYYDPETGRFITRDPQMGSFESPQTLNRYTYCANNPLKYIDPTGLSYQQADQEAVDEAQSEGDDDSEASDDNPPIIIQLDEDTVLTLDVYAQSGNVLVGYGYITNTGRDVGTLNFQIVFVVILLNDDADIQNLENKDIKDKMIVEEDRLEKMTIEDIVSDLSDFVKDENAQDLGNALTSLYVKVRDLAATSIWKAMAVGGLIGGGMGLLGGPAVIMGILSGMIGALSEHYKWYRRQTFISDLLILGGLMPQPI